MTHIQRHVRIQEHGRTSLPALLLIGGEPDPTVSITPADVSGNVPPLILPLVPVLSHIFRNGELRGTLWQLPNWSWGVWVLTSQTMICHYLSGQIFFFGAQTALLLARGAGEVSFLEESVRDSFEDGGWRFAPTNPTNPPWALLASGDAQFAHMSGRMGRILQDERLRILFLGHPLSLYFEDRLAQPQGQRPPAFFRLQTLNLGLTEINWNTHLARERRYNLLASTSFRSANPELTVLCSCSEDSMPTPWTYELCLGHLTTELASRELWLFEIDVLGERRCAVERELIARSRSFLALEELHFPYVFRDGQLTLFCPQWCTVRLRKSGKQEMLAFGLVQTDSSQETRRVCEIFIRRPTPAVDADFEEQLQENLRLCRRLANLDLHPQIIWPEAEAAETGQYTVWQYHPWVKTVDVPQLRQLIVAMTRENIFPNRIHPYGLRQGETGLLITSKLMGGLVSTVSLETQLFRARKEIVRGEARLVTQGIVAEIAEELTIFCVLCLLWGRARTPSVWDQLHPELSRLSEELEKDVPEIMEVEVATGRFLDEPRNFWQGTALAFFWEELRADVDLKIKLQDASFFPREVPTLSQLLRRGRAQSI